MYLKLKHKIVLNLLKQQFGPTSLNNEIFILHNERVFKKDSHIFNTGRLLKTFEKTSKTDNSGAPTLTGFFYLMIGNFVLKGIVLTEN